MFSEKDYLFPQTFTTNSTASNRVKQSLKAWKVFPWLGNGVNDLEMQKQDSVCIISR